MTDLPAGSHLSRTIAATGGPPAQHFEYVGRLGPLYWLFIRNLLLSIVTLGIYRFWGRTRIRRYIWSNTRFMGDAFEYTGKGSELFAGFLIVFGIIFVVSSAIQLFVVTFGYDSPLASILDIVFPLFVVYFVFVAHYAAQRYRLTRTVWRGLRGGMTGSAWSYGGYAFALSILSGFTVTLAWPWARSRMIERRLSSSYFGDSKVTISFSSRPLYPSYVVGFVVFLIGMAALVYAGFIAVSGTDFLERLQELFSYGDVTKTGRSSKEDEMAQFVFLVVGIYFVALVLIYLYSTLCFAWFNAATAREVAGHSTFQELRFASSATGGQIAWLAVTNLLLMLLTLYLAYPVVVQRTLRFIVRHLHVYGTLDVERLRQTTLPKSRTGEGLLEVFDPGLF